MLKNLVLPFFAAAVFAPVALIPAQACDTHVMTQPAVVVPESTGCSNNVLTQPAVVAPVSTVLTQPAVVEPASSGCCNNVLTQPAVVEPVSTVLTQPAVVEVPMQHYRVLQYPAVTTPMSTSCSGVLEQSAVIAPQPRLVEFDVPMPRVEEHRFGGLGILNPLNWF